MREAKDFKTLHGAHENHIQEEKKKTITAHTWGSSLWPARREEPSFISITWKGCEFIQLWEKKSWLQFFGGRKQSQHFLEGKRKWIPAFGAHCLPSSFPWTKWQPHSSLSPGDSLGGRDLLGRSEGYNPSGRYVVRAAYSCPAHLNLHAGSPVQWWVPQ